MDNVHALILDYLEYVLMFDDYLAYMLLYDAVHWNSFWVKVINSLGYCMCCLDICHIDVMCE